jgi:hypothetical protein
VDRALPARWQNGGEAATITSREAATITSREAATITSREAATITSRDPPQEKIVTAVRGLWWRSTFNVP